MVYDTFDSLFSDVVGKLVDCPEFECDPRGMGMVRESLVQTFTLSNPRARLIMNPARAAAYGFGVGEFLWYWRASDDLDTMVYYNKRMRNFSDDGKTLNSAYGKIMRRASLAVVESQWENVVRELKADPHSRRAVMTIFRPGNLDGAVHDGSRDVPCTLSLQFFIRNSALHLHVIMRSNDAVWGLTYDLFSFTLLQECMLLELRDVYPEMRLGSYHHTAGSLHIYERHWDLARRVVQAAAAPSRLVLSSGEMEPLTSLEHLGWLCADEEMLRLGKIENICLDAYTGGLRWMASALNDHRRKRDAERTVGLDGPRGG